MINTPTKSTRFITIKTKKTIKQTDKTKQDQTLQHELETIKHEFNDFTYTVSHDLGAPLRAVVSFSKLIMEKYENSLDEKGKRYLDFVLTGGQKAQSMLQGLLQYSRLHTQANPHKPVAVSDIIHQCRTVLKDKISACGADLAVDGLLPTVEADPEQLLTLFAALLDNALTYHKPGAPPTICVGATEQAGNWQFMIRDNGIGISQAHSARIFDLFKRLHTDEEYPGIGMGLTLARRIVDLHGGAIEAIPGEHGGTVIRFTLAKTASDAPHDEKEAMHE
jgi:light-regulated signal transduction histidine kinase (bacteriophytochrome)